MHSLNLDWNLLYILQRDQCIKHKSQSLFISFSNLKLDQCILILNFNCIIPNSLATHLPGSKICILLPYVK